jgi:predicted O-linked N-acetylglucosamine transferase (SPINDLY family)
MTDLPPAAAALLQEAIRLHTGGRPAEALAAYTAMLQQQPGHAGAWQLLGLLHSQQRRPGEALRCYERALAATPAPDAKLHLAYALALRRLGRQDAALAAFDAALALQPDNPSIRTERAVLLFDMGRHADALPGLDLAARRQPDHPSIAVARHFAAGMICRWNAEEEAAMQRLLAAPPPADARVNPFPLVFFTEDPALQRRWAEQRAAEIAAAQAIPLPPPDWPRPGAATADRGRRIRVGYLSHDLRNHAVGHIMAELFELHDRERFDILLLSTGRDDGSEIHRRYRAIAGFHDLSGLDLNALGRRIRELQPDILIDLQGYTVGSYMPLLAQRLAPVQIDWIGFPGTMGRASQVDYIMADAKVIPPGMDRHYSEAVIRLPHCYQPNNRQRIVGPTQPRSAYGLPEAGTVFACFNRPVKIRPAMFAAWMDILRAVPDSLLMLYAPAEDARANLRREAERHGIDAARLQFAGTLPQEAYLARYRAVDLVLDTYPYGSHSTASDCLWAGTPLLALTGETFASRVAGSILQAVGLPELVTTRLEDYVAAAIRLGRDAAARTALRERLRAGLPTAPLFDTPQMARDVEAALAEIWNLHGRGAAPRSIALPPAG